MAPRSADPETVPASTRGGAPLRLGLCCDGLSQQAWAVRALERLGLDPAVEVAALILPPSPVAPTGRDPALFRLYSHLDRRWSPRRGAPLVDADLGARLPGVPQVHLDGGDDGLASALAALRLDLALDLGHPLLREDAADATRQDIEGLDIEGLDIARLGVLRLSRGHRLDSAAGAREVLAGAPALETQVLLDGPGGGRVVARSWLRTDVLSLAGTASRCAWRASHLLERAVRRLARQTPEGVAAPAAAKGEPAEAAAPVPAVCRPSSIQVLGFAPRLGARLLAQARRKHLTRRAWFVAYQLDPATPLPGDLPGGLAAFHPLRPPRDRFWADPFPVVRGDTAHIFVEEWPYDLGHGRIAVLEMDRHGGWRRLGTALERGFHLSYPFVFTWQADTYMIPESAAGGDLGLYRAVDYPLGWERVGPLLDEPALDATLMERDGIWWMFANRGAEGVSHHDELYLYSAGTPLGPWQPHPCNPVVSDVRGARPAGRLIEWQGALYRPAQDCSRRYGCAVEVRRVVELTADTYVEKPHHRLDASRLQGANRTHTLNTDGWLSVVDGHFDRWGRPQ